MLPFNNLIKKGKTFCPVSNFVMECSLERAISQNQDAFIEGNLFGYLHDYSLIIEYMRTTREGLIKNMDVLKVLGER